MELYDPLHPIRLKRLKDYITRLPGLVAYYPMWESSETSAINYAPSTLKTINGTITGSTINQPGLVGKSYNFNGSSNSIDLGSSSSIQLNVFTYFGIIKTPGSLNQCIRGNQSNGGIYFGLVNTNKLVLNHQNVVEVGQSTDAVPANTWTLVGLTYTSGGVWTFNINGVASGTGTSLKSWTQSATWIGRQNGIASWFSGNIQHFSILSRVISDIEFLKLARLAGLAQ